MEKYAYRFLAAEGYQLVYDLEVAGNRDDCADAEYCIW